MRATFQKLLGSISSEYMRYETKLGAKFPRAYKIYLTLRNGSNQFTRGTFQFVGIKRKLLLNSNYIQTMPLSEVEVFRQIPRDWKKVAPVMIIAAFPFLPYIILPIAYMNPDKLLCRQFWSKEQFLDFNQTVHFTKIQLYDQILNCLSIQAVMKLDDPVSKNFLVDFVQKVRAGEIVDDRQIIELKPILRNPVFRIKSLSSQHKERLLHLYNCRRVFNLNPNSNLVHYAFWLKEADKRLSALKTLDTLPDESIHGFSFERGINAKAHSINELIQYLTVWLRLSEQILPQNSYDDYTLYLHLKILLHRSTKTLPSRSS